MSKMRIGIASVVGLALCVLMGCYGIATRTYDIKALKGLDNIVSVLIVGSGPAGLSSAIYSARAQLNPLVIDGPEPGGLLTKTTEVQNWPGNISIQGPEIVNNMKVHAKHLGSQFLNDSVEKVDFSQWPFTVTTQEGVALRALSVIIATGGSPRKLGIKGEDEYWGSGVTSCAVCDAPFYKGEKVVVIGGGDSAIEEAMQLSAFAQQVTILVRKSSMRAAASMQSRLNSYPNISVMYNVEPQEIVGDGTKVTAVLLRNAQTNETVHFETAGVFLAVGHDPNTAVFKGQLPLENDGYITVKGRSQATTIPGVFAAGDVEDKVYRQARVAEGSGVRAALDAERFLRDIGWDAQVQKDMENQLFKTADPVELGQEVMLLKTPEEFAAMVNKDKAGIVVIDFYADYCPSCMKMLPIYESVATTIQGRGVTFAKVDAQEAPDLVKQLFVHKVPCLLVYRDGVLAARYHDVMERKELVAFIEQFLSK